jgi:hypothetical protein
VGNTVPIVALTDLETSQKVHHWSSLAAADNIHLEVSISNQAATALKIRVDLVVSSA